MSKRSPEDAGTLRFLFVATREVANEIPGSSSRAAALLFYVGCQPDQVAAFAAVKRDLALGQSQASRLSASLMKAGLIEILTPAEDRRTSNLRLTARGRSVIGRIIRAAQSHR
jgi:DNA-binding MarR family transcriptional regulator